MNRGKHFSKPILFLIFNRPDTTKKVFGIIKKIEPPKLYIAADGPRSYKEKDAANCAAAGNVNLISNLGFGHDATTTTHKNKFSYMQMEEMKFPLTHPPI